jgi:tetratricopeptide (TPR) repeat protein
MTDDEKWSKVWADLSAASLLAQENGDFDRAWELLEELARVPPAGRDDEIADLLKMGSVRHDQGRIGEAEELYRSVVERRPASIVASLHLFDLLLTAPPLPCRPDEALEEVRRYYSAGGQKDPDYEAFISRFSAAGLIDRSSLAWLGWEHGARLSTPSWLALKGHFWTLWNDDRRAEAVAQLRRASAQRDASRDWDWVDESTDALASDPRYCARTAEYT